MTSTLQISGLRAGIGSLEILRGVDLEIHTGEVHVVMGPNGAGKSTLGNVLMGYPGYEVTGGSVLLDGVEILGLPTWKRAQAGLFLAPQDPVELPGVSVEDALYEALTAAGRFEVRKRDGLTALIRAEAREIGLEPAFLQRGMNVDCSGGEKKRIETLQLATLRPKFAVLDELDSGLDIDALRAVAKRIERATTSPASNHVGGSSGSDSSLGVLAITHYGRLLDELHPDVVHVLVDGRITASGGPELAEELERSGYGVYARVTQ